MPGRVEAASLLLSLDPPPWFVRHARAVAEVAGWLAARIDARGIAVDRRLVEAAALLHDTDKALPADDPARALRHGEGSAAWLTRAGHPELARAVANHPVTRLADAEAYRRWAAFATREERIVAYADKRAGQRLESLDARFARWRRRHPPTDRRRSGRAAGTRPTYLAIRARAGRLEADVCRAAGVTPDEVRRLRWTGAALAAARHRGMRAGRARPMTTVPLAFFWGDDELSAARAVDRFEATLATEGGAPLERWTLRGNRNIATGQLADLNERVATPVMFGGGTMAIVQNPGALVVKNEDRDAFLALDGAGRARQCAGHPRREPVRGEGAGAQAARRRGRGRRRHDPPVPLAEGRRAVGLDRGRGPRTRADARARAPQAPRRACRWLRPGGRRRTAAADPDRLDGARQARALPRARHRSLPTTSGRWSPKRSRVRSGRSPTRSASGGSSAALGVLERLFESTPEPVLLAVLHRRDPRTPRDRATASTRASACPRSARRWGSTASSGWRSCAIRPGAGRPPS